MIFTTNNRLHFVLELSPCMSETRFYQQSKEKKKKKETQDKRKAAAGYNINIRTKPITSLFSFLTGWGFSPLG